MGCPGGLSSRKPCLSKSASDTLPEFSDSPWTSPTAAEVYSQLIQSYQIKAQASSVGALSVEGMKERIGGGPYFADGDTEAERD